MIVGMMAAKAMTDVVLSVALAAVSLSLMVKLVVTVSPSAT
jgi:hypothetical protein